MTLKVTFTVAGLTFESTAVGDEENPAGPDVLADLKGAAAVAPQIFEVAGDINQAALAANVKVALTSPATPNVGTSKGAPPPDEVPHCAHGAMKDLKAKNYKFRYYCPVDRDDPTKCNPAGRD